MSTVLTCPRCLQSRSLHGGETAAPFVCPFCHFEMEASAIHVEHPAHRMRRQRGSRGRSALALVGLFLLIATLPAVVMSRRGDRPGENRPTRSEAAAPGEPLTELTDAQKPAIVLSGAVTPASPIVHDRKLVAATQSEAAVLPAPRPASAAGEFKREWSPITPGVGAGCLNCHNTHMLATRRDAGANRSVAFLAARLDQGTICPVADAEPAEAGPAKH